MYKYKIGIIDDKIMDIRSIKLSLEKNTDYVGCFTYEVYTENQIKNVEFLINDIFNQIASDELDGLIIDQNMVYSNCAIKGSEFFEVITWRLPEFPVIILTNYENEANQNQYVDSDKVYSKADLFPLYETSKKLVDKYLRNLKRTRNLKINLRQEIDEIEDKLLHAVDTDEQDNLYDYLYVKEKALSKLVPVFENEKGNEIRKLNLADVMNDLEKIEDFLNGKNL